MPEDHEIEARGVEEGINPMFGNWSQIFEIEPVSYANKRDKKDSFRTEVRAQLKPRYVFIGEVRVEIILYLNEQKALENPAYGDLDNYAKQILDTLKGCEGILIDDCQVQSLAISWIDVPTESSFEVSIKSRPDEFMQKSLKLYEMPDEKYYPLSKYGWTKEGLVEAPDDALLHLINALSKSVSAVKKIKHKFRQSGVNSLEAYRDTQLMMPQLVGFHKSAVIDSGFELVAKRAWKESV